MRVVNAEVLHIAVLDLAQDPDHLSAVYFVADVLVFGYIRGAKLVGDHAMLTRQQPAAFIRPLFEDHYTMSFENYPTEMERLHHPEVVPCTPSAFSEPAGPAEPA